MTQEQQKTADIAWNTILQILLGEREITSDEIAQAKDFFMSFCKRLKAEIDEDWEETANDLADKMYERGKKDARDEQYEAGYEKRTEEGKMDSNG